MALTSTSFVFLSLFAIHQTEATWTPTIPALALTCNLDAFDLAVTYTATTSADYSQVNDLQIGDALTCAETGTGVGHTQDVTITKAGVSYGTTDAPGCGTGAAFTNDDTKIEYTSEVKVTVRVTKSSIQRVYIYGYNIKCTLTRSVDVSTSQGFTVSNTQVEETVTDETFNLDVTLEFRDDSGNAQPNSFQVNNKEDLYIVIKENTPVSTDLKFTVQQCFASNEADASASDALTGDIIDGECPVDSSVTITDGAANDASSYSISTRAFTIATSADATPFYLHCNIFVCLQSENDVNLYGGKCVQNSAGDCAGKRKRRSIVDDDEQLRGEIITSVQTFTIIDDAYTTYCPEGHVFDTFTNLCTHERIFKILGVHLEKQWDSEYANSSSAKFQWFAKNTAREIRALILATGVERQIRGIKVIAARPGSVILDVLITYGEEIEPREAFETFKNVLHHTTPQVSRLVNVLNVIKEKTVELVPVEMESKSSLDKNFIIVVVFAVIAVAFISAITLYQVQKLRRRQVPPVAGVTGIFNSGMEKA